MKIVNFENFINLVKSYNPDEVEKVTKAYDLAKKLHANQRRESGEEYIMHPLNVAYLLAEMHADADTLCAGLLHDTLEDTNITKKDIEYIFNPTIAMLVDGVTKMSKVNFSSKEERDIANTRKIITGINEDVRIIIIKLADRLHNMRTLEYKSSFKQKENSIETMEVFVPLAYYIGTYRIKNELEDISFKYLYPEKYDAIEQKMLSLKEETDKCLKEMLSTISDILDNDDIPHEIKLRTKNIYGIYKRLEQNQKLSDIHDLLAIKVMVDDIKNCYLTLGYTHSLYPPMQSKMKDYISSPKTNMYQSLHTTVFGPMEKLVQIQIRTFDMDKVASFGLTTYWDINKGKAKDVMQNDLKERFQFFKSLNEINAIAGDNQEFVCQVKRELFGENIYVYTYDGKRIELPKGSTPIDFAYKLGVDIGNTMIAAIINDKCVDVGSVLHSNDRVRIITNDLAYGLKPDWEEKAHTSYARKMIKEISG